MRIYQQEYATGYFFAVHPLDAKLMLDISPIYSLPIYPSIYAPICMYELDRHNSALTQKHSKAGNGAA